MEETTFYCDAGVLLVRQEFVDVTVYGGRQQFIPGETHYSLNGRPIPREEGKELLLKSQGGERRERRVDASVQQHDPRRADQMTMGHGGSSPDDVCGKTVERVAYSYDEALRLYFTDGTMLYVAGVWHNDSTAGTEAALLPADAPKSWEESERFYEVVQDAAWKQPS